MQPIEIIVIVASISIVLLVFGRRLYKRIKGIPLDDECVKCHSKINVNKMVTEIQNELNNEKICNCHK